MKNKKDKLKGGYADKVPYELFDKKELAKGIKIEMEHTNDKKLAREISSDHLYENQNYYKELEAMEFKMGRKRVIEFYSDGSLKYVDKRYLMKSKDGLFYLMHNRAVHWFDMDKEYIKTEKL